MVVILFGRLKNFPQLKTRTFLPPPLLNEQKSSHQPHDQFSIHSQKFSHTYKNLSTSLSDKKFLISFMIRNLSTRDRKFHMTNNLFTSLMIRKLLINLMIKNPLTTLMNNYLSTTPMIRNPLTTLSIKNLSTNLTNKNLLTLITFIYDLKLSNSMPQKINVFQE